MTPEAVAGAMRAACLAELRALKPGNVHAYADGHDMTVADFEASAAASAAEIARPGLRVGERIYQAVRRTREAVGCNTNLGIVLLCAPLAHAALQAADAALRDRVAEALAGLDVADADWAFRAIRLAMPAGLAHSARHDVRAPARVDLRAAMAVARQRDLIARQYVTDFQDVFALGLPRLRARRAVWGDEPWAAAAVYLGFLARFPDSHIVRKHGAARAEAVRREAQALDARLMAAADPTALRADLLGVDARFKAAGLNPGTSADLTVASLFADKLEDALDGP